MEQEPRSTEHGDSRNWMIHFKFLVNSNRLSEPNPRSLDHPAIKQKIRDALHDYKPVIVVDESHSKWIAMTVEETNTESGAATEAFFRTISSLEEAGFKHCSVWEAKQIEVGTTGVSYLGEPIDVTSQIMQLESQLREFQYPES